MLIYDAIMKWGFHYIFQRAGDVVWGTCMYFKMGEEKLLNMRPQHPKQIDSHAERGVSVTSVTLGQRVIPVIRNITLYKRRHWSTQSEEVADRFNEVCLGDCVGLSLN